MPQRDAVIGCNKTAHEYLTTSHNVARLVKLFYFSFIALLCAEHVTGA